MAPEAPGPAPRWLATGAVAVGTVFAVPFGYLVVRNLADVRRSAALLVAPAAVAPLVRSLVLA
ncbi:MAG: hypothetical protein M3N57_07045, partial [Actinomycetota bacterium]|nr:hypothetical protein [Actinomycetota bacterium]